MSQQFWDTLYNLYKASILVLSAKLLVRVSTTIFFQDQEAPEVDEATREYLKQIELQKKKREEFLRQKEERRRQKMLAEAAVAAPSQPVTVERKAIETLTTTSRDFKVKKPTPLSNANRIVVAPNDDNLVTVKNAQNSNPFLNNRTVLAKDQDLVSTPVVVVNNLSAGTTEGKIRKLCSGIGEVKVRVFK